MAKTDTISKAEPEAGPSPRRSGAGRAGGRVCVGAVAGARGLKGEVRIKSFTADPGDVAAYGPVETEDGGRRFEIRVTALIKGAVAARLSGVEDRDAAAALKGTRLYVPRDALPDAGEGTYYHADLVGLEARAATGERLGRVKAVHNFGAGDVLEIEGEGTDSLMVPFTAAAVPEVDVRAGRIVVEPLPGLLAPADDDDGDDGKEPAKE